MGSLPELLVWVLVAGAAGAGLGVGVVVAAEIARRARHPHDK